MVRRKGCINQWPYLVLGAMLGALLMYRRDLSFRSRELAPTAGWKGVDERERSHSWLAQRRLSAGLRRVDLQYADLRDSDLTAAGLQQANLRGANLERAGLASVNLTYANLTDALLYRAVLFGANLQGADLSSADLRAANLLLANLLAANVSGAQMDEKTTLPNGEHWTPGEDLSRFTCAEHPRLWRSPLFAPAGESVQLSG